MKNINVCDRCHAMIGDVPGDLYHVAVRCTHPELGDILPQVDLCHACHALLYKAAPVKAEHVAKAS